MRKLPLGGLLLASLVAAGPAMAADMKVAAPVTGAPVIPPAYNWTACYIGGNAGLLWATKDWTDAAAGAAITSQHVNHWVGGGQAGCDIQLRSWVVGIQGDYTWMNATASSADLLAASGGLAITDSSKIKAMISVTDRIGYAADRFLGYVKGGAAWEREDYEQTFTATGDLASNASETRLGWTVGGGAEYAFTNWLTGFFEYDYYDFGKITRHFSVPGETGVLDFADIKETNMIVKVGFNLQFGGWSPSVTSKY